MAAHPGTRSILSSLEFNPEMIDKKKYYVVWVGRQPGVYSTWEECKKQVTGFVEAKFKSYPTREIALVAFQKPPFWEPTSEAMKATGKSFPPRAYLCVDAACSGSPGPVEWRVVSIPGKKIVVRKGPFPNGSNNIGEFLALVDAIRFHISQDLKLPIFTDSVTALAWLRAKKCKTTLPIKETNIKLYELIMEAESILLSMDSTVDVRKWNTAEWGEIPADFGRK